MGITEILLLVIGTGVFVISFLLPEKREKLREADKKFMEAQIRKILETQMEEVRTRVSGIVDETVAYAVDKTERSMERLSNEKIMAVSEYSDTVLEAIHKNHEEVVFLYDMLNDKQQGLKDAVSEVERRSRDALQQLKDAEAGVKVKTEERVKADEIQILPQAEEEALVPLAKITGIDVIRNGSLEVMTVPGQEEFPPKGMAELYEEPAVPVESRLPELPQTSVSFAGPEEDGKNNNERILSLHRAGKSNMAIAKELGLGIGEVKLVIDLFRGV